MSKQTAQQTKKKALWSSIVVANQGRRVTSKPINSENIEKFDTTHTDANERLLMAVNILRYASRLVSSHLIPFHPVSSHLIPSHCYPGAIGRMFLDLTERKRNR